jgi:hypothetical protein
MRWLLITIALLATSACLLGWIYLRDRDPDWRPPSEGQLAPARRSPKPPQVRGASSLQPFAVGTRSSDGEAPLADTMVGGGLSSPAWT